MEFGSGAQPACFTGALRLRQQPQQRPRRPRGCHGGGVPGTGSSSYAACAKLRRQRQQQQAAAGGGGGGGPHPQQRLLDSIGDFAVHKAVPGGGGAVARVRVADAAGRPFGAAADVAGGDGCEMRVVSTPYNGDVAIPVSAGGALICDLEYPDGRVVQVAVYDAGDAPEDAFVAQCLGSPRAVSDFISATNAGAAYPVATAGASPELANAFFAIVCYLLALHAPPFSHRVGLTNGAGSHAVVAVGNVRFTNAFWCGHMMVFGNAKDRAVPGCGALTSVDVCGHELTHALQTFSTEFVYSGESGALNESIADVVGTFLEAWVASPADAFDWTLGEQFAYVIRNMADPKSRGDPAEYGGEFWVDPRSPEDNGGVHTNSGVPNFACYLAVAGGGSSSGSGAPPISPPAGFGLAEYVAAVYAVLESRTLSTSCSLADFADAMVSAAARLHGEAAGAHVAACFRATRILPRGGGGGGGGAPLPQIPQFPLPQFPLPQFPLPQFPQIPLPQFPLPQFPLPQFPLPQFPQIPLPPWWPSRHFAQQQPRHRGVGGWVRRVRAAAADAIAPPPSQQQQLWLL